LILSALVSKAYLILESARDSEGKEHVIAIASTVMQEVLRQEPEMHRYENRTEITTHCRSLDCVVACCRFPKSSFYDST
jgi:hypothetical protein